MPVRIDDEVTVTLDVDGEAVTTDFPPYGDPAMHKAIRDLCQGRVTRSSGGRPKDNTFEARCQFYDRTARRIHGVEVKNGAGVYVDLSPENFPVSKDGDGNIEDGWLLKVPPNLKASFAIHFEERGRINEETQGN